MVKNRLISIVLLVSLLISCDQADLNSKTDNTNLVSFIRTNGSQLVDDDGNSIILKGTNLGNWLVPEGYMFKMGQVNSPRKIDEL